MSRKNPNRRRKETVNETRDVEIGDRTISVELEWEFTRSYENDDADGNRGEWVNFWELVNYEPKESLTKEETIELDMAMDDLECPENTPDDEPDPDEGRD